MIGEVNGRRCMKNEIDGNTLEKNKFAVPVKVEKVAAFAELNVYAMPMHAAIWTDRLSFI